MKSRFQGLPIYLAAHGLDTNTWSDAEELFLPAFIVIAVVIVEEASVPRKVPVVGAAKEGVAAAATGICWSATAKPYMGS